MTKKAHAQEFRLRGQVLAYNISPKGHIEGAVIETDRGLAQLNFAKHGADARTISIGSKVDLVVDLEHEHGAHPVYIPTAADAQAHGTIVRLNYALHGDVNGCHLDEGTFVHVKPDHAKRYDLRVGAEITATGSRRVGDDAVVLDADKIKMSEQRIAV